MTMRFMPNTSDGRQPVTFQTQQNVKILKNKQKCFLDRVTQISSGAIQGLDFHITDLNLTLREDVMNIRSQENPAKPLFLAVNEDNGVSCVTFLYLKRMQEEAFTLVPALTIVLEAHYGDKIWSWFNAVAKEETYGWFYCKVTGTVKSKDDVHTNDVVSEWAKDDGSDDDTAATPFNTAGFAMDLTLLDGGLKWRIHTNPYEDGGTVDSRRMRSEFGGDDSTDGGNLTSPVTKMDLDVTAAKPWARASSVDSTSTPPTLPSSILPASTPGSELSSITTSEDLQMQQLAALLHNPSFKIRAMLTQFQTTSQTSPTQETGLEVGHNE
jgi:hypothetical protein